jgi:stage II sporulation protein D
MYLPRAAGAAAHPTDLTAPIRVRLLAGFDVVHLNVGENAFDAPTRSFSTPAGSKTIGPEVFELSGNPYLDLGALIKSGQSLQRRYTGTLFVQLRGDSLFIVNHVDVETYIVSVMSAEVSPGWAAESLRAQAIAVRTYAAHSRMSHAARDFDLTDDTSSQVYRGIERVWPSFTQAAQDTKGQIVTYTGAPASIFYSSSCGGHTASSEELTGRPSPAYLKGMPDLDPQGRAYCSSAPYFRWKNSVARTSVARIFNPPSGELTSVEVVERWPDGRVKTVSATSSTDSLTIGGREFYKRALAILGYKVIPSAMFDVSRDGDNFAFVGHGVGHGVGMCQWGARGRADRGMTAEQILQAYFPGTNISKD